MKPRKILVTSSILIASLISVMLLYTSCTKDNNSSNNNNNTSGCIGPQPKLQFKSNGVLYNLDAVYNSKLGWIYPPQFNKRGSTYFLSAGNYYKNSPYLITVKYDATLGLEFSYTGNKLLPGNYTNDKSDILCAGTNDCAECFDNTITIIITNITNGYASGTFSGIIPAGSSICYDGIQQIITEGTFSNVPIFE